MPISAFYQNKQFMRLAFDHSVVFAEPASAWSVASTKQSTSPFEVAASSALTPGLQGSVVIDRPGCRLARLDVGDEYTAFS